jgi:hypothetical protein
MWLSVPTDARVDAPPEDASVGAITTIEIREALAISGLIPNPRTILSTDPVATQVLAGTWAILKAGDSFATAEGQISHWDAIKAENDGSLGFEVIVVLHQRLAIGQLKPQATDDLHWPAWPMSARHPFRNPRSELARLTRHLKSDVYQSARRLAGVDLYLKRQRWAGVHTLTPDHPEDSD